MKTSIVIPVHNAFEHVTNLLSELVSTEAMSCDIIIVDDCSEERVRNYLFDYASVMSNVSVLVNPSQQLFTRTVNRGIRAATPDTDFILEINTDCRVKPGFINEMLAAFEKYPKASIVGYPDGIPDDGQLEVSKYPSYVTGHCIMIPRKLLLKFGLFCETDLKQAHISSERLWCWKTYIEDYHGVYVHKPLVIHNAGGPSWKRDLHWLNTFDYSKLWPGRDYM